MMERVLKLMTLKNVIKTLSIVLIFIILTGCGNKLSITISDNKRDFKVIEKTDYIELNYKDKIYNYTINSICEEEKTGYIHINKTKENQLILTTCSPKNKDKQLIIESILSK